MAFSFFILGFFVVPNLLWWSWAHKRLTGGRSKILLAVFMLCEGNHDRIDNGDEFIRRVKASGVPLLVDESVSLEVRDARIHLHGTRWRRRQSDTQIPAAKTRDPASFPCCSPITRTCSTTRQGSRSRCPGTPTAGS